MLGLQPESSFSRTLGINPSVDHWRPNYSNSRRSGEHDGMLLVNEQRQFQFTGDCDRLGFTKFQIVCFL